MQKGEFMKKNIQLQLFLDKSREREYIRLPFSVDADMEMLSVSAY